MTSCNWLWFRFFLGKGLIAVINSVSIVMRKGQYLCQKEAKISINEKTEGGRNSTSESAMKTERPNTGTLTKSPGICGKQVPGLSYGEASLSTCRPCRGQREPQEQRAP